MAKRAYIGVGGAARKVKKIYVGVSGVARKVKKAYIGVGGVARPCFSGGGQLTYYGQAPEASGQTSAGAYVGGYAVFSGYVTEAYNASLTKTVLTSLSRAGRDCCGTSIPGYAIFFAVDGYPAEAYNTGLTKVITSVVHPNTKCAAASVGEYALFAGGMESDSDGDYGINTVTACDTSLTASRPTALALHRWDLAGASIGNYALFGGGDYGGYTCNTVDAYDTALTRTNPTGLDVDVSELAGAASDSYAIFGGGYRRGVGESQSASAYNAALTRFAVLDMYYANRELAGGGIEGFSVFAGGEFEGNRRTDVTIFDDSLTRNISTNLSVSRVCLSSARVGNYLLFGGGRYSYQGGVVKTVDAFLCA